MKEVKGTLSQLSECISALQKATESDRPKKKFKKVITCPYDDCGRRYSSKIALNCHIRTKHNVKSE